MTEVIDELIVCKLVKVRIQPKEEVIDKLTVGHLV